MVNPLLKNETIWLTGPPASGKTTIAKALYDRLYKEHNIICVLLDGDDVRKTISSDLGFSNEDRTENIRRITHVCNHINKSGVPVIASFVSPTDEIRKSIFENIENPILVNVATPLEICVGRDKKGTYVKQIYGNTEMSPYIYEPPMDNSIFIDGSKDVETSVDILMECFCYKFGFNKE